jgi:glycosyltransferase involved in cell wall biosynthesis
MVFHPAVPANLQHVHAKGAAEPARREVQTLSDPEVIALSWFGHRRTESLCRRFGWTYWVIETRSRGLIRYLRLAPRTIVRLARKRPQILVVQNPSLVLTALCLVLRPFLRYRLVVDAHNEAVQPYVFSSGPLFWISRWCLRRANVTIVTNEALAQLVRAVGGTPFVLPDPLPAPPPAPAVTESHTGFRVVVISTFAADEPLAEILSAASRLEGVAEFSVTGNLRRLRQSLREQASSNVTFTGFLPESEYWTLLRTCDVAIDLTLKPDCLVCGAYEAVAVRRPVVLTDSAASRTWFGDAAIYVHNDADSIESALREVRDRLEYWTSRVAAAAPRIERAWEELQTALRSYLLG